MNLPQKIILIIGGRKLRRHPDLSGRSDIDCTF